MPNSYILKVLRTGGTARVIAYGDDDSCSISSDGKTESYSAIKFHHTFTDHALKPYKSHSDIFSYEDASLLDEDYFVEFKSGTKLSDFCFDIETSEFQSPNYFSAFKHNCADGANFALSKIDMVAIYPMLLPAESKDCLASSKFKLYLYKQDERIFFKMQGEQCDLPNFIIALAKRYFTPFDQLPDNPKNCRNKEFCDAVLKFTSANGYTSRNFKATLKQRLNRFNDKTFVPIPFIRTPYELFEETKKFKIKQLEDYGFPFKLELAKKALEFRVRSHADNIPVAQLEKMISESDKRLQNNYHHAEFYLKLLIDTIDMIILVLNNREKVSVELYKQSAVFFKNRVPCKIKNAVEERMLIFITSFIGMNLGLSYLSYQANQFYFKDNSLLWKVPSFLFFQQALAMCWNFTANKYINSYIALKDEERAQQEIKDCHATIETPLSQAITDLAEEFEKKLETAPTFRR